MLNLSRKERENVLIGDNIQVTVIKIEDDKVVLGFDAPREIPIYREEVYKRIISQKVSEECSLR